MTSLPGIPYEFSDSQWLECALTHSSYAHEKKTPFDNEKLEYLGDAVLDLVIGDVLFQLQPDSTEGQLSRMRASLVNEEKLAEIAKQFCLSDYIKLGKGEFKSGGSNRPRLLASALEALLGAIYKDGGYSAVYGVVNELFCESLKETVEFKDYTTDYKTRLQELIQQKLRLTPTYRVLNEVGPSHQRDFQVEVIAGDLVIGQGAGSSKKYAEQMAAKDALEKCE